MITLYNKSSEHMKEVSDSSVHLIVTSPPYPMIKMWDDCFAENNAKTFHQMHFILEKTWNGCYTKLVPGGIMAINIGDACRKMNGQFQVFHNHAMVTCLCQNIGFTVLPYILWKKPSNRPNSFLGSGMLPPNGYVTIDCEFILLFRKGGLRKFKPKDIVRQKSAFTQSERNTWFSQIWDIKGVKQTKKGVTGRTGAFPKEIPYRLIRMFSLRGETVLDPFCGTGTTLEVARDNGRHAIGYETSKELCRYMIENLGLKHKAF